MGVPIWEMAWGRWPEGVTSTPVVFRNMALIALALEAAAEAGPSKRIVDRLGSGSGSG